MLTILTIYSLILSWGVFSLCIVTVGLVAAAAATTVATTAAAAATAVAAVVAAAVAAATAAAVLWRKLAVGMSLLVPWTSARPAHNFVLTLRGMVVFFQAVGANYGSFHKLLLPVKYFGCEDADLQVLVEWN